MNKLENYLSQWSSLEPQRIRNPANALRAGRTVTRNLPRDIAYVAPSDNGAVVCEISWTTGDEKENECEL